MKKKLAPLTVLNMVIGYPLHHTLSPHLHNFIYQHANIPSFLMPFSHPKLFELIQIIKVLHTPLIAVTMPYKEAIIPYLDKCTIEVSLLGANNTIIQKNNKLTGYNTDIAGIRYALRYTPIKHKKVLILGAGGGAKAAAYVIHHQGGEIYINARTKARALQVCQSFSAEWVSTHQLARHHFDIIINTTPVGMAPNSTATPLPHYAFKPYQTVFDFIYNPLYTPLLQCAAISGAHIITGLDMFIAQGLKQIELWTNKIFCTDDYFQLISPYLQKVLVPN